MWEVQIKALIFRFVLELLENFLDLSKAFQIALFGEGFQMFRLFSMIELAPIAIGAVELVIEIVALLGPVVRVDVRLLEKFMLPVSECTFWPVGAFRHFPVTANFRLEFLLEIRLGGDNLPRLDRYNVQV